MLWGSCLTAREIQCHFTCHLGFCHLLISSKTGFKSACMVYILMTMNKELMAVTELANSLPEMSFNPATTRFRQAILPTTAAGGDRPSLVIFGFFLSSESQGYQNLLTLPLWNSISPESPPHGTWEAEVPWGLRCLGTLPPTVPVHPASVARCGTDSRGCEAVEWLESVSFRLFGLDV